MLSYATKEITLRAGDILGGLLNITFSILLNLLLILSICFFFRGINRIEQYFNITVVDTAASFLALYVGSLIILTAFHSTLLTKGLLSVNPPKLSRVCLSVVSFFTALVAFCPKFIVNSISNVTASGTISTTFVGLILLLIIRNAAKYIIAVTVAYKDEISLVINVAIRSSIQITLLVLPFVDYITLYFNIFLIAVLFVAMLLVNYLI
ncbi:hypothetical protein V2W45_1463698 [Cenococcum geophilum]